MNKTNLPIIQSLWIGTELSLLEKLSITSFIKNNHKYILYTYDKIINLPEGVIIKDANEIIAEKHIFKENKRGSYAIFADWFRWELLYKKGGFWVDTDVICVKPFIFDTDVVFGLESFEQAGTAVLGFPPNHFLTDFFRNICKKPNTILPYDNSLVKSMKIFRKYTNNSKGNVRWGEAGGPKGFSKALKHFNLFDTAKPFTFFYPIAYANYDSIFDRTLGNDLNLFSNTYSLHLWNEMFRRNKNFDKNGNFDKNSLIERLKVKYS